MNQSNSSLNSHSTLHSFQAYCPLMTIYSILALLFVVVAMLGISLPFDLQTFEGSTTIRIVTAAAGVLGLIASFVGIRAAKVKSSGQLRLCGILSIVMILLYCVTMVLSDGHTNPHVWILLGSTSIIPGSFGGTALRLAAKGWDDNPV